MFNLTTPSLENTTVNFDGTILQPVICETCFHALRPERRARSAPKSYAALASSPYTFIIMDWKGLSTQTCECCGSRSYNERHIVAMQRKGH